MAKVIVGFDFGNSSFKAVSAGAKALVHAFVSIALDDKRDFSMFDKGRGVKAAKTDLIRITNGAGVTHLVGAGALVDGDSINSVDVSRFTDPLVMKPLFHATMTKLGVGASDELTIIAGLPFSVAQFDQKALVKGIKDWALGRHEWFESKTAGKAGQKRVVNVAALKVMAQADAIAADYDLDDAGLVSGRMVAGQSYGVLSIGHGTIELSAYRNGQRVNSMSASHPVGFESVVKRLAGRGASGLEIANRHSQIVSGEEVSDTSLGVWMADIKREVSATWGGNWRSAFSKVIVTGYGAVMLGDRLNDFFGDKFVVADDPTFAVARGLRKVGLANEHAKDAAR